MGAKVPVERPMARFYGAFFSRISIVRGNCTPTN